MTGNQNEIYKLHQSSINQYHRQAKNKGSSCRKWYPVVINPPSIVVTGWVTFIVTSEHISANIAGNNHTKKFNSLAPGKFEWNSRHNFQTDFSDWWLRRLLLNCPNMNVIGLCWWSVNIGSGNGLVPSGNKPLPEPMLTQISVTIWRH